MQNRITQKYKKKKHNSIENKTTNRNAERRQQRTRKKQKHNWQLQTSKTDPSKIRSETHRESHAKHNSTKT